MGKQILAEYATAPNIIDWKNLGYSNLNRGFRQAATILLTIILIVIAAYVASSQTLIYD
jgi:hypothetical protein